MATAELIRKRKLSKGVLEMKFMKKSKDREEKEREIEESTALFSDQITDEMKSGANKIIIERSVARCKGLSDGRLSYHGMNPEIERLMEIRLSSNKKKEKEISADVSDAEMAKYNLNVNEAVAKRFMTKNERQAKRPKFMKPSEDD